METTLSNYRKPDATSTITKRERDNAASDMNSLLVDNTALPTSADLPFGVSVGPSEDRKRLRIVVEDRDLWCQRCFDKEGVHRMLQWNGQTWQCWMCGETARTYAQSG